MCRQYFLKLFQKVQEIWPVSLFFRIWTSAKPRPMKNGIWQSFGLDLVNINVYANFITIFHLVQEIGPFSLFQILENFIKIFQTVQVLWVFLAHLSRRLTRWAYRMGLEPASVRASVRACVRASTLSNMNISETSRPITTKFIWSIIGMGERLH